MKSSLPLKSLPRPHLEWFRRRWQMPEDALPAIEALLASELSGGTAVLVEKFPANWGSAVQLSSATEAPGETPLILHETPAGSFLQSRTLFEAEQTVAQRLVSLAQSSPVTSADLESHLADLFPQTSGENLQVAATRLATTQNLAIITGGPGTGKTYTLARILAVLATHPDFTPAKIRLAAPTGKAAQRMKEAIGEAVQNLPENLASQVLSDVAESCSTLHSLLGYNPSTGRCREQALPKGVTVILDECSMIDLAMWATLLRLLPDDARLILLGDPCQLESVGQGAVLAELTATPLLAAHRVHLTESHRFRDCPGLQHLAAAMLEGDADRAVELLESARDQENGGLLWLPKIPEQVEAFPAFFLEALARITLASTPEVALEALTQACLLTAHRESSVGSLAWSQKIENLLRQQSGARFFPIIINRNDASTGLKNGTLGVLEKPHNASNNLALSSTQEAKAHFFVGGLRQEFSVARLPEFSSAGAITIHRSQGSEYDRVMVLLPRGESPLSTRELLYTAITRAKKLVAVCGDLADIHAAVQNKARRCTMLQSFFTKN